MVCIVVILPFTITYESARSGLAMSALHDSVRSCLCAVGGDRTARHLSSVVCGGASASGVCRHFGVIRVSSPRVSTVSAGGGCAGPVGLGRSMAFTGRSGLGVGTLVTAKSFVSGSDQGSTVLFVRSFAGRFCRKGRVPSFVYANGRSYGVVRGISGGCVDGRGVRSVLFPGRARAGRGCFCTSVPGPRKNAVQVVSLSVLSRPNARCGAHVCTCCSRRRVG